MSSSCSTAKIPPVQTTGPKSIYGPKIKALRVGQSCNFSSKSEQIACYNWATRNGYSVSLRKIDSLFHVFVKRIPKKRGAK